MPSLKTFCSYFESEWINGKFCNWQVFHSPVGYATTNNALRDFQRQSQCLYDEEAASHGGAS
ncbi:TPA: hypothetical protein N0F65_011157 [Lagenidium giganteum]|uniref:Uncharacterized protein n=1 Tax=Lagenidium giganteum TaxID=4803 RepID=A0AAV2ZBW7_9STRA|nr:TPA: hypothetical protein N0F65_011157 [Lagenidium giganteum]